MKELLDINGEIAAQMYAYYLGTNTLVPDHITEVVEGHVVPKSNGSLEPGEVVNLPSSGEGAPAA